MAATDPQKQLLTLIRNFASEKSQGERRIVGLKKRIQELQCELDLANTELEDAKRLKETTEQELKGYEVELAMNEASIQTLEARISLIQDEISVAGSDVEALKLKESIVICQKQAKNLLVQKMLKSAEEPLRIRLLK
ncbi:hypothetical protein U1Q18_038440 [Sarracenia purpurea var. burkii]